MIVLKNILVATDFSEPSDAALTYGRDLARSYSATMHVVHVVDNLVLRYTGDSSFAMLPDLQGKVEESAREQLKAIVTDEDRSQLRAKPTIVTSISAADAIVDYARDHEIDLIVIGTHGRRALGRLLMGSVAERVVRSAPCPVLTVRHPEREFVAPDALVAQRRPEPADSSQARS
jgi:nucleotide-binding universal stress UspA family protein